MRTLVIAALLLGACGGSSASPGSGAERASVADPTPDRGPAAEPEAPPAEAAEPVPAYDGPVAEPPPVEPPQLEASAP